MAEITKIPPVRQDRQFIEDTITSAMNRINRARLNKQGMNVEYISWEDVSKMFKQFCKKYHFTLMEGRKWFIYQIQKRISKGELIWR